MRVRSLLTDKLTGALAPLRLSIADESERHRGHAGAAEAGETHFRIEIVSAAFRGLSRVARHRLVHTILADELSSGIHALALTALTPEEDAARKSV